MMQFALETPVFCLLQIPHTHTPLEPKVARACEPASARLSLQAMRLSYFKNSDFAASLQINIML